jgi:hypothetical protein
MHELLMNKTLHVEKSSLPGKCNSLMTKVDLHKKTIISGRKIQLHILAQPILIQSEHLYKY